MHSVENGYVYATEDLTLVWSNIPQLISQLKHCYTTCNCTSYIAILLSLMFVIPFKHNWYLNIHLNGKIKSSQNAHFRFSILVLLNQKLKKEKWQCSQNLDLNPTFVL